MNTNKYFLLIFFSFIAIQLAGQNEINLSGKWLFEIDRDDVGETEQWYLRELCDTIELPGSMPENDKGDEVTIRTKWTGSLYDSSYYFNPYMEKYRQDGNIKLPFFLTPNKHYVGAAWYKKRVNIPKSWKSKRVELYLERPHIETTLWINGQKVGTQNSLCVPHIYDISSYLKPGNCDIYIRIDNRIKKINVGPDSHSVTDQTQGNWNGIVGRIELQSTPTLYFDDIQIYPEISKKQARVKFTLYKTFAKTVQAEVTLSAKAFNTDQHHKVPAITSPVTVSNEINHYEMILPMGKEMLLWDEFSPTLYQLSAEVNSIAGKQLRTLQFGMRDFKIDGKWFYVNGRKTMLRGTVENCTFPLTGYAPMDVDSWKRVFSICRNYGLNHMRFHSYCPPRAAFIAADEIGFYLQPEGPSWPNHGPKLGIGQPIDTFLMEETIALTKHFGNHPSYCMLAAGNEPSGKWVEWVSNFVDYWKANDSRRVYTGASVGNGWKWQPKNEYHVKAGARGLSWSISQPMTNDDYRYQNRLDTVKQPYVSHETGQWCAFPNFNEINKYTGVNKAKNFEIFQDLLKDHDMEEMGKLFLQASGKLQTLCYKYEIEKTLRTPDYAGFQLLSLNDYSGQGTALVGVLDVFFDEKGYVDAPTWRKFCSTTVPLMRTDKFVYTNDDCFIGAIEVAHFGEALLSQAVVNYLIKDENGKVYVKGNFEPKDIPIGNLNLIDTIRFSLSEINRPTKLNLEINIAQTNAINDWNFWVYPKHLPIAENDIYITDLLDENAIKILEDGGNVLITAGRNVNYGKDIIQHFTPVFWNTSWFKMRPPHVTGILLNPHHPLFNEFPTEYHSDIQW